MEVDKSSSRNMYKNVNMLIAQRREGKERMATKGLTESWRKKEFPVNP